jgi:glycerophosphoryl diester phosphodiesterase
MKAFFRTTCFVALSVMSNASLYSAEPAARRSPEELLRSKTPLVIGHRGAPAVAPENTASSFREAIAANADLVELDYYVASDGTHVVFHDKTLDRTTDALKVFGGEKLPVVDRSWKELSGLDAGSWYAPKFAGEPIPRLDEALDLIQSGSVTLIERKHGPAKPLVELLAEKKLTSEVVVQAFDWDYLKDVAKHEPSIVIGALGSKELGSAQIEQVATIPGLDFVGWSDKDVTPAAVEALHAKNLKVFTYTVNDVEAAKSLVAMGVDGIITDDPAAVAAAIRPAVPASPGVGVTDDQ